MHFVFAICTLFANHCLNHTHEWSWQACIALLCKRSSAFETPVLLILPPCLHAMTCTWATALDYRCLLDRACDLSSSWPLRHMCLMYVSWEQCLTGMQGNVELKHCQVHRYECDVLQARAHLLNVGIIRPRDDVTASDINAYLSRRKGAPPSVGRITDTDKTDVPRFLNRSVCSKT